MLGRGLGLIGAIAAFAAATTTGGCTPRPSAEEPIVAAAPPIYCYETLALPDCFAEPLGPFDDNRLIGYYSGEYTGY
jgi:hypothetical protein